jgi:hypothetical protein
LARLERSGSAALQPWPRKLAFAVRSEIACLVVTHHLTEEAMPWMKRAREIFGRLVIFIDQARAFPGTEARAREIASVVYLNESAAFFGSDFKAMIRACESEWVMFLDHDEELSAEWSQPGWRTLLSDSEFTHYFCPRRWVLSNRNFIAAEPWWPDLQLRLFRADAPVGFPTKPHEPVAVSGNGALLRHLAIHHHIWLLDHSARQKKTKFYDSLVPGGSLDYFYLYEEFHPSELPVPPPRHFDPAHDVITMPRLNPEVAPKIELEAGDLPPRLERRKLFWSRVLVRNRTDTPIASAPLFPVRLSYHWRDAETGAVEVYDGLRSGIVDPIPPGQERELEFVVLTPARAGRFLLELTLVQEQNFWFDQILPGFAKTFRIELA